VTQESQDALRQRIDIIEAAYEFMLAYAAQGRESDQGDGPGENIREFLRDAEVAMDGLGPLIAASAKNLAAGGDVDPWPDFADMVGADASRARVAFNLVLAQPSIGSELIDNLNASNHVRTLLTDLFLADEALKAGGAGRHE
jgi:hypothetical protein